VHIKGNHLLVALKVVDFVKKRYSNIRKMYPSIEVARGRAASGWIFRESTEIRTHSCVLHPVVYVTSMQICPSITTVSPSLIYQRKHEHCCSILRAGELNWKIKIMTQNSSPLLQTYS
jgi:hypothetical protein